MTQADERTVNVPLLRKAVEWAEAEAMKPPELCEWVQAKWILRPDDEWDRYEMSQEFGKAPECGTCYCIAGFVSAEVGTKGVADYDEAAAKALGIEPWRYGEGGRRGHLFDPQNTIEDVRRIAEELAGERL